MFILEHFWKFLLIIVIGIAGYFTWLRYDASKKQDLVARNFAGYFDPTVHTSRSNPARFEEAFLQAVATAHQVLESGAETKKKGDPLSDLVKAATEANGLEPVYASAAIRSIKDALGICAEFGIFDDGGSNFELMEIGKAPIIQKGPYEGEPLVPAPLLNPLVAIEGHNQLLNTTLVPAPIRILNSRGITGKSSQAASAMKRAEVLTSDRIDRVKRLYRSYRDKSVVEIKAAL